MSWIEDTDGGNSGKFISLKLGETQKFEVVSVERTTENEEWHPKTKNKISQGWHLKITDTKGRILEVGSYALQSALREAGLKDRENPNGPLIGRHLTISHEDRGSYQVLVNKVKNLPLEDDGDVPF